MSFFKQNKTKLEYLSSAPKVSKVASKYNHVSLIVSLIASKYVSNFGHQTYFIRITVKGLHSKIYDLFFKHASYVLWRLRSSNLSDKFLNIHSMYGTLLMSAVLSCTTQCHPCYLLFIRNHIWFWKHVHWLGKSLYLGQVGVCLC